MREHGSYVKFQPFLTFVFVVAENEWIEDCFLLNTTLEVCGEESTDLLIWYTTCNRVCNSLGAGLSIRNSIPKALLKEEHIKLFVQKKMAGH
jgi:hypothetical protein